MLQTKRLSKQAKKIYICNFTEVLHGKNNYITGHLKTEKKTHTNKENDIIRRLHMSGW